MAISLPGPSPRTERLGSSQDLKARGSSSRSPKAQKKAVKPPSTTKSIPLMPEQCFTIPGNDANPLPSTPDMSDREGTSRSSRTTEAERRSYLESHSDVAELEPHRVKCRCCGKWLKLSSTQNYALAPWKLHKKACTSEKPCPRKPRLKGVSLASGAEDDDASSIAPSISASEATGTSVAGRVRSSADRQRLLEDDELSGEVRSDSIFCSACAKWVKLSTRTAYQLKNWVIHTERMHGRTEGMAGFKVMAPSNRIREAERKLKLVNDAQARDFTASRVTCKVCSSDVTLNPVVPYQLENWLAHKAACPSSKPTNETSDPGQGYASKPVSTGSNTSLTLTKGAKSSAPPSTSSTDLTYVARDGAKDTAFSSGRKRAREDEEGEEGSKVVRPRTSSYTVPNLKPSGPWGWLKLPWETFKRGFAEGLGAGRGEDSKREG
ncbi:hypothetical protein ACEPAI_4124 [Sanghuangporus weigelae]